MRGLVRYELGQAKEAETALTDAIREKQVDAVLFLMRARAIETGCFGIAPCMWGSHSGDRKTFGHSLIVDPWGEVLADGGEGVGIITADLDLARVDKVRAAIPALAHDRAFLTPGGSEQEPRRAAG